MVRVDRYWIALAWFIFCVMVFLVPKPLKAQEASVMKLTSPEFENNNFIPEKFTCEGEGVNPQLDIVDIPSAAKSLALIVDDPDAVSGTFIHWVVFDIPLVAHVDENSIPGKLGFNDGASLNYTRPCPPSGTHRYFFKLYALNIELNLEEGISCKNLLAAMEGHIVGYAELIGLYKKRSKS